MDQASSAPHPAGSCCPVIELRQYTLHPGTRDTLIDLFDREFVEPQEAVGMRVIGQFRDLDRADVFTWLRGFDDMPSRASALAAFYDGPVWGAHRDAANATMISFDNVRLLRPATPGSGFALGATSRRARETSATPPALIVATIYTLSPERAERGTDEIGATIEDALRAGGAEPLAVLVTEPSANTFPRLPVREGERALVWLARFRDADAYAQHVAARDTLPSWRETITPMLDRYLAVPPEVWRLTPTARSLVR